MNEPFFSHLREALEVDQDFVIDWQDDFKAYEVWDSLTQLNLIATLDDEYRVDVETTQLEKLTTVQDLYDYIQSKKG